MGMRFRRSIRIAPGIRLNLSGSGFSTTIGPRGASVNIGRGGAYLNTGIPGTGISFREKIGSRSTPRTREARAAYRSLKIASKETEKREARLHAQAEHDAHEAKLASFSTVLADRNQSPYDWNRVWASRGTFVPEPLPSIVAQDFDQLSRVAAARSLPMARWLMIIVGLTLPAIIWGDTFKRGLISLALVGAVIWAVNVRSQRALFRERYHRSLENQARLNRQKLEAAHRADVVRAQLTWDNEEAHLSRIRTAAERGDLESLAQVLEAELDNEAFPVPLVLDLELESTREVRIEFVLPELNDIPDSRTQVTKTGKLSPRKMAQRDRVSLYEDLCTGIALRLVYETLRVLGTVEKIEAFGVANTLDASTGHDEEFVALHLATSREAFRRLGLDLVDASSALEGLGGQFSCNRRGELAAIPDVVGLSEGDIPAP